jgi:AbrB family looped-hinge helix DNA binding protein
MSLIIGRSEVRVQAGPLGSYVARMPNVGHLAKWYILSMAHDEIQVTVGERGRVVLPSAVRTELDLKPGTHMLLTTEHDGSLRLRPYRVVAEQSRGLLRDLPGGSMVDELLAERRAEAAREDEE